MKKCDKEGCCEYLQARLVDMGRGFQAVNSLEFKDGHAITHFLGVMYRKNAADRGLYCNFCPFCGGTPGEL